MLAGVSTPTPASSALSHPNSSLNSFMLYIKGMFSEFVTRITNTKLKEEYKTVC